MRHARGEGSLTFSYFKFFSPFSAFFSPFRQFPLHFSAEEKSATVCAMSGQSSKSFFFLVISLVLGNQSGYAIVLIAGLHVTS